MAYQFEEPATATFKIATYLDEDGFIAREEGEAAGTTTINFGTIAANATLSDLTNDIDSALGITATFIDYMLLGTGVDEKTATKTVVYNAKEVA